MSDFLGAVFIAAVMTFLVSLKPSTPVTTLTEKEYFDLAVKCASAEGKLIKDLNDKDRFFPNAVLCEKDHQMYYLVRDLVFTETTLK